MGKTKNAGLGIGTTNVPQGGITQSNVEIKANDLAKESMLNELKKAGVNIMLMKSYLLFAIRQVK